MAAGEGSVEPEDKPLDNSQQAASNPSTNRAAAQENNEDEHATDASSGEEEDGHDNDEEDEEPRLKYAALTRNLGSLYRNGDSTSACLVGGDKMIVGTHSGYAHVLLMPSLRTLKLYQAHKATVTSISISPYPPPVPAARSDTPQRLAALQQDGPDQQSPSKSPAAKRSPRLPPVPKVPSNDIFVGTSSMDGNVCISSLIDADDIQLRNFGRPVQAVALSPEFRSDRTYLSGGQAGSLILTIGGQKGKSVNASTTGAAAAASGWLGSIGLGANSGTDRVLHSGEGIINTIKWSLSGKYVLWVNEAGITIMHSHLQLPGSDAGLEWKRIKQVDRPDRSGSAWQEMAGVWKARVEWIDRNSLEIDEEPETAFQVSGNGVSDRADKKSATNEVEEVLVGWGDTVWFFKITPGKMEPTKSRASAATVQTVTVAILNDCIISGISMFTDTLILVLAHMEKKPGKKSKKTPDTAKRGRPHRHNGLQPELRIINLSSQEEIDSDTLQVSKFEMLSSSDYHLTVLGATRSLAQLAQRGYLEALGNGVTAVGSGLYSGVETVGQGMYDATMYGPRRFGVNRLFSGNESIRSGNFGPERAPSVRGNNPLTGWIPGLGSSTIADEGLTTVATTQGMKIFIMSPFDCVVGIKRNLTDRLQWFVKTKQYKEAWELLEEHPEVAGANNISNDASIPSSPSRPSSLAPSDTVSSQHTTQLQQQQPNTLAEFFTDSISVSSSPHRESNASSKAAQEKRKIGELWVDQLVKAKKWDDAGEIAGKTLDTTNQWQQWVWIFLRHGKVDEISPFIPTFQITPPLPSSVFEFTLGHYVSTDRSRFKELLDQWPSDLFEVKSIISAIDGQLSTRTISHGSTDWRILQECLAKLSLADGNYQEALRCYIRLQDADTALSLIKEHHLVETLRDDIASFVLLRIPKSEIGRASKSELEDLSSDPIKLLVDEATHGVVETEEVVAQLQAASLNLFLFFYFRALWRGEGLRQAQQPRNTIRGRAAAAASLAAGEGKLLVEQHADTAVDLFAEYDRDLLLEFLQASTAYTYEKALKICEARHYIEELVYLLSKTGAMKKALFLIIDELQDVSKAITFAKEQDDKVLWNDFLEYSMSRPQLISGLLAEVGTAIDPIELVKRIPSGLEIEGLKDGLKKMIREYDVQDSISSGVAKVLSSEVAVGMDALRQGRRKGIKFEVLRKDRIKPPIEGEAIVGSEDTTPKLKKTDVSSGHCAACEQPFVPAETETLVGFACGHVYHVSHLFHEPGQESAPELALPKVKNDAGEVQEEEESYTSGFTKSVGPKVTNARLLRDRIDDIGGCKVCARRRAQIPME